MEQLDYPTLNLWNERNDWFWATEERIRGDGSYILSEQACAISADVAAAFCAGAWVAVQVLAVAVIDASLREDMPGFKGSTKSLLDDALALEKMQSLRKRRNSLVHVNPESPALTIDAQSYGRKQLEKEARIAVECMFEAMYYSPGT